MQQKNYILFIDSGVGGLSILERLLSKNNNLNILYFADVINFPYGEKDENTIGNILINIYQTLSQKYTIKLIAIACNTASVSALEILRKHVDIPVVGTVPAVKLASKTTTNNNIGVIATETTIRLKYLTELIDNFASDKTIHKQSAPKLVKAIENFYNKKQLYNIFKSELAELKSKNIDTLVLGCTHYSFAEEHLKDFFDNKISIIDSRDGVSNRILQIMPESVSSTNPSKILFINKKSELEKYKQFNKKLNIFDKIITDIKE